MPYHLATPRPLTWRGEAQSGQRLPIMAYPGKGDKEIVHRNRK